MRAIVAAVLALWAVPAIANDTTAVLGTGGLAFISTDALKMVSEDLFISPEQVKVTYQFRNLTDVAQDVLVAFPLPDISGDGDFNVAVPDPDDENLFGFTTTFAGRPVEATLHRYAFAFNLDQTAVLEDLGVPLEPFGEATRAALAALDDDQIAQLQRLGMVIPLEYSGADDQWQTVYEPAWTLRSTYSWEAHFEPREEVEVVHSYTPSVGGTVGVSFLAPPDEYGDRGAEYRRRYCTDDAFVAAVRKTLPSAEEYYAAPFKESWISYVWSTGNNWAGPIETFTLTIDKGAPQNLVSFCWDGDVEKVGPSTFRMSAKDWYPPWNRELDVLILNRYEREN